MKFVIEQTKSKNCQNCELKLPKNDSCNMIQEHTNDDNSNNTAHFASMHTEVDEPPEPIYFFMHTNEIRVKNNKLVSDMSIPIDGFKKIMEWAKDAFCTGYQFKPKTTKYRS